MDSSDWIKILAGVVSGGAAGACLTYLFTEYRNRIQSINTLLSISSIDLPSIIPGYKSLIALADANNALTHHYTKILTVQLKLTNKSNKDFEKFDFGITLPIDAKIIGVQHQSNDRLHVANYNPTINFDNPTNDLDVTLTPFHRENFYFFDFAVSYSDNISPNDIKLSQRQAVKFVSSETTVKNASVYRLPSGAFISIAALVFCLSAIIGALTAYQVEQTEKIAQLSKKLEDTKAHNRQLTSDSLVKTKPKFKFATEKPQ